MWTQFWEYIVVISKKHFKYNENKSKYTEGIWWGKTDKEGQGREKYEVYWNEVSTNNLTMVFNRVDKDQRYP